MELTPEELEEIRKREERKDRLHQNYLKRKASGAQKRYEEMCIRDSRNIMNEYYARDTSRKSRSTFQSKGKSGKHLTGTVIYGYLWNEARDQWLVDPEAAEVVML